MKTKIEEVADRIYWMESHIPATSAEVFAVYFIKENGGALIDPGPAVLLPSIRNAMTGIGMAQLDYVIPTHIHMDYYYAILLLDFDTSHRPILICSIHIYYVVDK